MGRIYYVKNMTEKTSNGVPFEAKNFEHLFGTQGLSDQLLKNHFALYQGYVANVNKLAELLDGMLKEGKTAAPDFSELKRRFGWEWNGMRLHEYYFENISKKSALLPPDSPFLKKTVEDFGSRENWEKDFRAVGAMRGIGWVIMYYDPQGGRIYNAWINEHDAGHLSGAIPLIVMDVFEHAYTLDYGIKKSGYIEAFFKAADWNTVIRRFDAIGK
jgi:superoxide dismutase, Fe-Mn family